ncbi:AAA-ATPase At3g28580-like [Neltuma alba]|uniref:AAA-ATPase At3g28580-like n=1 Tax=Neltuma alba TaxID=207710 RepID=UPI0010A5995A|nr:AAA-ATPase At3g28580-like [Prosopis alba]
MEMATLWAQLGSAMATLMFLYAMIEKFPPLCLLRDYVLAYIHRHTSLFSPYVRISFSEYSGDRLKCSEAFSAVQTYLSHNFSQRASRLKAELVKNGQNPLVLSMDDNEEVSDEFHGVKIWWLSIKTGPITTTYSHYPVSSGERLFTLKFHKCHRDLITRQYLRHVLDEGKAIASRNRQIKLLTNNPSNGLSTYNWSRVVFEHPASFDTLALHPKKKEEIVKDLVRFKNGKNYYAKIGKPWKRGYLLYGPPGTGKSTMIAAMANFLNYDIYDLELTAVKNNTELRKLLIQTHGKSIIVIEDIDCSLNLTGQRKKMNKNAKGTKDEEEDKKSKEDLLKRYEEEEKNSKVTLSGLLNFIDGVWSSCGGERIIVFTTNFVDKLDPALIRRGRMDKHIELSYCCYEAFKVLAKNYLNIESHHLFSRIEGLLKETEMTPADVAENLMPKSMEEDEEICLKRLIEALEMAKTEKKEKDEGTIQKDLSAEKEEKSGEGVKENGSH